MADNRTKLRTTDKNGPENSESLNFKVSSAFKKEFKGFAVAQGVSMTDLLKEGLELSKLKRKG